MKTAIFICLILTLKSFAFPGDSTIKLSSDSWHALTMPDGSGLYFDIIRAVYEPLGFEIDITIVPYARSIELVRTKSVDGWVASFMDEQEFPLYPKWHFDRNRQLIVNLKESQKPFSDIQDLTTSRLVWLRDFNLHKYIPVPVEFEEIDDIRGVFPMLNAGSMEFFIGAESDIEDAISETGVDRDRYEFNFLMYMYLYMAFADTPRGEALRKIWDERMEELHSSPKLHAIYESYNMPVPFDIAD